MTVGTSSERARRDVPHTPSRRAATAPGTRRLLEIHDVAPESLDAVAALLERRAAPGTRAVLAVIPDRPWSAAEIRRLGRWDAAGHELALHGFSHWTPRLARLAHRVHQTAFSRQAAENLALPRDTILSRTERGRRWFLARGLTAPRLYVPPAWTLGAASPRDLAACDLSVVEHLLGFTSGAAGAFQRWPLEGFEADTTTRAVFLGGWNAASRLAGAVLGRLRVVLHPRDAELRLRDAVVRRLRGGGFVCPRRTLSDLAAGRAHA